MAENRVGRPGKRRVEMDDGSVRTFTKESLDSHLDEAIIYMATNGITKYDRKVFDSTKQQGEVERQHENISLFGRTVADLLKIKSLGGVIETP